MNIPKERLNPNAINDLGPTFLGLHAYQLLSIIDFQGTELLAKHGIDLPSRTVSTMMHLLKKKRITVTGLAHFLGMSHQLVGHRIKDLKARGLVAERRDPGDLRRTLVVLTKSGEDLARQIEQLNREVESVYLELFEEIGVDLFEALIKAKQCLIEKSLGMRIAEQRQKFG